jgi:predicted nucleic acid-binding protein
MDLLNILGLRKNKPKQRVGVKDSNIKLLVQQELQGYIKRENLQEYIDKIQRDREKKKIWDGMSTRQKLMLVRHIAQKRGLKDAKK